MAAGLDLHITHLNKSSYWLAIQQMYPLGNPIHLIPALLQKNTNIIRMRNYIMEDFIPLKFDQLIALYEQIDICMNASGRRHIKRAITKLIHLKDMIFEQDVTFEEDYIKYEQVRDTFISIKSGRNVITFSEYVLSIELDDLNRLYDELNFLDEKFKYIKNMYSEIYTLFAALRDKYSHCIKYKLIDTIDKIEIIRKSVK